MAIQPHKVARRMLAVSTSAGMKRELLSVRDKILDLYVHCRNSVGQDGALPHFVIIGTQKGGTTYLYDELVHHPQVAPALTKEVHFFDANYKKGLDWYRGFFSAYIRLARRRQGVRVITGEASPSYMFHPHVLPRLRATLPTAKLIMLLRNPVSRAYSHYHHELRLGFETLSFAEALEHEDERLEGELERLHRDEHYEAFNYVHFSYRRRGLYLEQVQAWMNAFGPDQLLILSSEAFYRDTAHFMARVLEFLELPSSALPPLSDHQAPGYPRLDPQIRASLAAYFKPHNRQLYDYLGVDFGWDD